MSVKVNEISVKPIKGSKDFTIDMMYYELTTSSKESTCFDA